MDREAVDSSMITSMGYEQGVVEVEFHNGSIYHYYNVPFEVYVNVLAARSVGKEFNAQIKNKFNYELK